MFQHGHGVFRAGAEAHDRPGGEGRAGERLGIPCMFLMFMHVPQAAAANARPECPCTSSVHARPSSCCCKCTSLMFIHVQDKASLKNSLEQEQDPLLGPSSSSGQFSRRDSATPLLQHQNSPRSSAPTPSTHPSRMRQTKKRKEKMHG